MTMEVLDRRPYTSLSKRHKQTQPKTPDVFIRLSSAHRKPTNDNRTVRRKSTPSKHAFDTHDSEKEKARRERIPERANKDDHPSTPTPTRPPIHAHATHRTAPSSPRKTSPSAALSPISPPKTATHRKASPPQRQRDRQPKPRPPPTVDADKDVCDNDKQHEDAHFYDITVKTRHVQYHNSTLAIRSINPPPSPPSAPSPPPKATILPTTNSMRNSFARFMAKGMSLLPPLPFPNPPHPVAHDVPTLPQVPSNLQQPEEEEPQQPVADYSIWFPQCVCCSIETRLCKCPLNASDSPELEDVLNEPTRMWWTITGNFGNILPIDWSKTYARQKYLPALNLNECKKNGRNASDPPSTNTTPRTDDDDDIVAQDLDMHQLILSNVPQDPLKSAEEVIQEIDDIMQEGSSSEDEGIEDASTSTKASEASMASLPPPLYHDKLKDLNSNQLNEILLELEVTIRQYSETLINQLALRDELEYEKELKNTFISLLLQVQNKRRIFNVEKKKTKKLSSGLDPKYLTTVIPYDIRHKTPNNQTVQILIKILTAINDDSPTVPTLLTDYILKVLCPS